MRPLSLPTASRVAHVPAPTRARRLAQRASCGRRAEAIRAFASVSWPTCHAADGMLRPKRRGGALLCSRQPLHRPWVPRFVLCRRTSDPPGPHTLPRAAPQACSWLRKTDTRRWRGCCWTGALASTGRRRSGRNSHLLACFAWFSSCNMIGLNDEIPEAWIVWNQSLMVIYI
jgi:hypothetical protein